MDDLGGPPLFLETPKYHTNTKHVGIFWWSSTSTYHPRPGFWVRSVKMWPKTSLPYGPWRLPHRHHAIFPMHRWNGWPHSAVWRRCFPSGLAILQTYPCRWNKTAGEKSQNLPFHRHYPWKIHVFPLNFKRNLLHKRWSMVNHASLPEPLGRAASNPAKSGSALPWKPRTWRGRWLGCAFNLGKKHAKVTLPVRFKTVLLRMLPIE